MQLKPHFMASNTADAQKAKAILESKYGRHPLAKANVVVALGGDGFMLDALKKVMGKGVPLYGLNFLSEAGLKHTRISCSPSSSATLQCTACLYAGS